MLGFEKRPAHNAGPEMTKRSGPVTSQKGIKMDFDMEKLTGLVAIIAAFSMPVIIVFTVMYFRNKSRMDMQKTIRTAIENGQTLPPEVLESLKDDRPKKSPDNDIRSGIILLSISAAFVCWSYIENQYIGGGWAGIAAILGFIGFALLILGILAKNAKN